jgi:hypothetical protein
VIPKESRKIRLFLLRWASWCILLLIKIIAAGSAGGDSYSNRTLHLANVRKLVFFFMFS